MFTEPGFQYKVCLVEGPSMGNVILFIIIGFIGIVSIFNLTVGKRNRAKADARNRDVYAALRDKAVDKFGAKRFDGMKKIPFMCDNGNAIIFCADAKSDLMALVTFESIYTMKYRSQKSCEIMVSGDEKTFDSVVCLINADELGQEVAITLAVNRHRRGGFVGKAIIQDAEQLKSLIEKGLQ